MLRITVLGVGYVGLVSGVCLSEFGHRVICVDNDKEKIKALQAKRFSVYEDDLMNLLKKNSDSNRLTFSTDLDHNIYDSDIIIIAVDTSLTDDGCWSIEHVNDCVVKIGKHASKTTLIVVKSTVPVGTSDHIQSYLDETSKFNCVVIYKPEFFTEGNGIHEFMEPDRIIIGTDGRGRDIIDKVHSNHTAGVRMIYTDRRTAELTKYASNTFLAMKTVFINEIAELSQKAGCDMMHLIEGLGSDTKIGYAFLNPSPGFGGPCFPKNLKALVSMADTIGVDAPLIRNVLKTNAIRIHHVAREIRSKVHDGDVLAVLGLTYKANTDDIRESPALTIVKYLLNDIPLQIRAFDPAGMRNAEKALMSKNIRYCSDVYDACEGASLAVILTEWDCFKEINPQILKSVMKKPKIYDYLGIINKEKFIQAGFNVRVVGYSMKEPVSVS